MLYHRTSRTGLCRDRYASPGIRNNAVFISIDNDIKTSNLIGTSTGLGDHDTIFLYCMLQQSMGMSANDKIHTPRRIQLSRQMPVLFKANMRQKNGKIDVNAIMRIIL